MAYSWRKAITIDRTKCGSASSTDFPLLVSMTDADLKTTSNGGKVQHASGYDIAFYSNLTLTTQLKHEVESYNAATGAVVMWVKIPTLSISADTVIYMAFGDSSVSTSQADPANVWDSNFKGVWHLSQDPSGTSPQILDSTSNDQDLASRGSMTSGDVVTGKIGSALDLDGSNDALTVDDSATTSITGALTLSLWFKMANNPSGNSEGLVSKWQVSGTGGTNQRSYAIIVNTSGQPTAAASGNGSTSVTAVSSTDYADNTWRHAALVYVPSTSLTLYIDGSQTAQNTTSIPASLYDGTAPFAVGHYYDFATGSYYGFAVLDEVRLSNTNRSASWVLAEYNNQNSPSTFYSVGTLTIVGAAAASIDGPTCSATATIEDGEAEEIAASAAASIGGPAASAVAEQTISAACAASVDAPSCASAASLVIRAESAASVDGQAASVSASLQIAGESAASTADLAASVSVSLSIAGAVAASIGTVECAATSGVTISGTCEVASAAITASANGTVALYAELAASIPAPACGATGATTGTSIECAGVGTIPSVTMWSRPAESARHIGVVAHEYRSFTVPTDARQHSIQHEYREFMVPDELREFDIAYDFRRFLVP